MRAGVIGHPISHSLSPALHLAAYRALGLDWTFEAYDVDAGQVAGFVAGMDDDWRGLAATMPCKAELADIGVADDLVNLVGVANTLVRGESGSRVYNTDVGGIQIALRRAGVDSVDDATIVGNGATARSALVALTRMGAARVLVLARDPRRATHLVDLGNRLGVDVSLGELATGDACGVLVSTIPSVGVAEHADRLVAGARAVFDVIYDPWPTPLVRAAEGRGVACLGGLDLLTAQASLQVELMTGRPIDVDVLLDAGWAELRRRHRE